MTIKTSKLALTLTTVFLLSILFSCNPWRKGSVIKGSNAKTHRHYKSHN